MSFKAKIKQFMFKRMGVSVLEQCGLNTNYTGSTSDEQLIAKIRGWSWTCIDRNAKACAQVPLRLYTTRGTTGTKSLKSNAISKERHDYLHYKLAERVNLGDKLVEVTDHPILDLLREVNPNDNAYDLKELTVKYLDSIGVDYWWLERGVDDEIINIWPLQSQYVEIVLSKDKKRIVGYLYHVGDTPMKFPKDDIVHFKYTSTKCPLKGDSPTQAGEQAIDLEGAMNAFEIASFKNGGNPSMVMEVPTDSPLSEDEKKRIQTDYRSMTGGVKNTGKLFISSGGAKIHEYGHSPKEMSYLGGRDATQEAIAAVYGVPTAFLKPTEISRDNLRASIDIYMNLTINPRLVMMEQKLNEQFTPNWGDDLFLLFDDARQGDPDLRLDEIKTHLDTGYSYINEEREKDGLDPVPWGEEPVQIQEQEQPEEEKFIDVVVEKRKGPTNDLPEPDFMPNIFTFTMTKVFKRIEAEVTRNLRNYGKPKQIEEEASDAAFAGSADDITSSVFNGQKWGKEIADAAAPFIQGLLEMGLVEAMEKVKPEAIVNASSPEVLRALDTRDAQIKTVADTVNKEIRQDISDSIAAGESRSQTIKRVRDKFDARFKADRVVRTETIWAHNEGTTLAWKQSGVVTGVEWDTVEDDRRCPYCAEMDGKTKTLDGSYFQKGDSLTVDSPASGNPITLNFDYEDIVHPPLHPQCRCQLIPIISD